MSMKICQFMKIKFATKAREPLGPVWNLKFCFGVNDVQIWGSQSPLLNTSVTQDITGVSFLHMCVHVCLCVGVGTLTPACLCLQALEDSLHTAPQFPPTIEQDLSLAWHSPCKIPWLPVVHRDPSHFTTPCRSYHYARDLYVFCGSNSGS